MHSSPWRLTLLISDGRHRCSRSSVSDHNLITGLQLLQRQLAPPPPAVSQPVWIRLDARPPGEQPLWEEEWQQELRSQLLEPLGLQRQPINLERTADGSWRLWLDRCRSHPQPEAPLHEALERARGWLLRSLERQHPVPPLEHTEALAALLLLRGDSDRPDLAMATFRLTRALQQPCPVPEAGRSAALRKALRLAVLAQQLQTDRLQPPHLQESCRALQEELLERFDGLPHAVRPAALFSLAMAQAHGLPWPHHSALERLEQQVIRLLERPCGSSWERCLCLLTLVVLAESGAPLPAGVQARLTPPDALLVLAALPGSQALRNGSSALRAVLVVRLAELLNLPLPDQSKGRWIEEAERILINQQCDPPEAIEAEDPQLVLGSFGGDHLAPAPLRQQLVPLLILHHLLRLQERHALD